MNDLKTKKIGEIVTDDFRTSEVFKHFNIDFCCGGNKTIEDVCRENKIDVEVLLSELIHVKNSVSNISTHNFKEWSLDFLCDYIVNTHHKTVLNLLPQLKFYTQKIADVHGDNHSELIEIAQLFSEINEELLQHLKNEEEVLFPAIKSALKDSNSSAKEIIKSEILRMSKEHDFAGTSMDKINKISNNYLVPSDGCKTYFVTFKLLKEFEDDLHIHVHLENNILYPKSLLL